MSTLVAGDRRAAIDGFAVAVMLSLTFLWGLNGVAARLSNEGFNPIAVILMRSALGGALVLMWCRYRGIRLFESDRTLLPGILAGFLFGAEFSIMYVGLDYTSVPRTTLMVNTMPFWVLIGAHFLLGERMSLAKVAGLVLAFSGVVLVFSDQLSAIGPQTWIGDLMALTAGLLWAATTLVIRRSTLATSSPEKLLLYQLAVASVMTLPLLAVAGPIVRDPDAIAISSIVFQAVVIVAMSYLVWFWILARYPASGLSSFAFLTPVFGVLGGGLILNEPLSIRIFVALALIAVGLVVVNRPARRIPPA